MTVHLPAGTGEDLRLLVSELVTNSVIHAGLGPHDAVTLLVTADGRTVRGEVHDPGPGFDPQVAAPRSEVPSGRGLYLVARLSRRWGVRRDGGSRVRFELDAARTAQALDGSLVAPEREVASGA